MDEDLTGDGGVIKRVIRAGEGPTPPDGAKCKIHFEAKLLDGTVVDSSAERNENKAPFAVCLGKGLLVRGLELALRSMQRHESAEVICRSDYAYGVNGAHPIPPSATLRYTVELCVWRQDLTGGNDGLSPGSRLKVQLVEPSILSPTFHGGVRRIWRRLWLR